MDSKQQGIYSPITRSNNVTICKSIEVKEIIDIYDKYFNMNVLKYFPNLDTISVCRCNETGFEFYWPLVTFGDDEYYQLMGNFEWYYNPKRWEHEEILSQIKGDQNVLEVGSGKGAFLNMMKKNKINCVGLELNSEAVEEAKSKGLDMLLDPIDKYAEENKEKYDIVCSFQVLEHVPDPFSFIQSSLLALKKGGKLIVAVPNNDSFISINKLYSKVLNMPPHHMGLWKEKSLKALEKVFPMTLDYFLFEPLVGSNVDVYLWNKTNSIVFGSKFLTNALWKIRFHYILRYFVKFRKHKIKGQTIIAVFSKNNS